MKEILDSKQKEINYCGGGMVVLFTNEKEITQTERVQTGVDTFEDKDITRYRYDMTILCGVREPADERSVIEALRDRATNSIKDYDVSDNINSFSITDGSKSYDYWLDSDTRNKLVHSVSTWKAAGNKTYKFDLRKYGTSIDVDCDKFLDFLDTLENYTVKCFNTTSEHLKEVGEMEGIEELLEYDYTKGYPEKVEFKI